MVMTRVRRDAEYRHLTPLFHRLRDPSLSEPERRRVREELVRGHLPLAEHIASRFRHTSQAPEDLTQVARLGLVLAVDRFDPARGIDFVAFAVPTITGEVRRYFRDQTWTLAVPRRLKDLSRLVRIAAEELGQELGRAPRPQQIAQRLAIPVSDVWEGLQAGHAYRPDPLDDQTGSVAAASVVSPARELDLVESRMLLYPALAQLSERESRILVWRFFDDLTQTQIAHRLGVSQMQVSRLLAGILARLREATGPFPLVP